MKPMNHGLVNIEKLQQISRPRKYTTCITMFTMETPLFQMCTAARKIKAQKERERPREREKERVDVNC